MMKLLALTLMTLFCVTSVTAQDATTATPVTPAPNNTIAGGIEICQWETRNLTCTGEDETISITSALYGRMRVGSCTPNGYKIGCNASVTDLVKSRCDGKTICTISLPDGQLHRRNQCSRGVSAYLQVDYECSRGKEYCQWETFNATCDGDKRISIKSALYGRMKSGRCLPDDYKIGCSNDVTDLIKSRCQGKKNCSFDLPDRELHLRNKKCGIGLKTYLEVDYQCNGASMGACDERIDALQDRVNALEKKFRMLTGGSSKAAVRRCRICFQETEGSDNQCTGARNTCSGWSNTVSGNTTLPAWTDPFRDDTDGRNGGCTYQWRIECE